MRSILRKQKENGIMHKFKVGDRVKCIRHIRDSNTVLGKVGTITTVTDYAATVKWEDFHWGHGTNRSYWHVVLDSIILAGPKVIKPLLINTAFR